MKKKIEEIQHFAKAFLLCKKIIAYFANVLEITVIWLITTHREVDSFEWEEKTADPDGNGQEFSPQFTYKK